MKPFKEFLEERKQIDEATLKTGTKVTVKNAKSYDALSKKNEVEGIVQGMMNKNTVMVKVGSGQMNVDLKDIVESVQIDEAVVSKNAKKIVLKDPHGGDLTIGVSRDAINIYLNKEMYVVSGKELDAFKELVKGIM